MSSILSSSVSYRVRVLPAQHELEVQKLLEGPVAERILRLEVPTWVPGDYSFMQYRCDLFDLNAKDVRTDASLPLSRDGWQAFRIEGGRGAILGSYRAYAYETEFGESCGLLGSEYAVLLGSLYLHAPDWPGACRVTYDLPAGWKAHHPAGATRVGTTTAWDYPSY